MNELLHELNQLTKNVIGRLEQMSYEEMEIFVESRQILSDGIAHKAIELGGLHSSQKQLLAKILSYDEEIATRLQVLRLEAKSWLERNQQIKIQQSAYQNAYSADSFFFDWKN